MLGSTLRISIRVLRRERLTTAIAIGGLAVGLTCALLVLTYVRHELSYEDDNPRTDRLCLVMHNTVVRIAPGSLPRILDDLAAVWAQYAP